MSSRRFRLLITLFSAITLSGALSGCVSRARYNRALEANQACERRLEEQQARLDQIDTLLQQARTDLGTTTDRQMTDETIIRELRQVLAERQGRLTEYENQLTVRILAKYLFDSGKAELTPAGRDVLRKVAIWLKESESRHIFVEGHTDTVPIGRNLQSRFRTNWELSTARATNVVRFLTGEGVSADKLIAVGYGENHPVAANDTEDARELNRRIEITLQDADFREVIGQVPQNVPRTALININEASAAELIALPGLTPEMARNIVEYRARAGRFDSFDDLRQVRGIDAKTLEPLESMITFGGGAGVDETGATPDMLQNRGIREQEMPRGTQEQELQRGTQEQEMPRDTQEQEMNRDQQSPSSPER